MTHPLPAGCDAFDAQLADYLEHALGGDARAQADAHLATCPRCQALVSDVRAIVRDAAALGSIEPPRDLWNGIAARIEAPIVPIGASRSVPSHRVVVTRRWLAIAASVLVATSIGGTYGVMRVAGRSQATRTVALVPSTVAPNAVAAPATVDTMQVETTPVVVAAPSIAAPGSAARTVAAVASVDTLVPAARTYDREIATLRGALAHRRDLDARTAAVVERNLAIIDDAIAACREALAHDPHNPLLGEQLTHTLDRKVELLRTAVLLPARS